MEKASRDPVAKKAIRLGWEASHQGQQSKSCKLQLGSSSYDSFKSEDSVGVEQPVCKMVSGSLDSEQGEVGVSG